MSQSERTKLCVIIDAKTPIIIKVPVEPDRMTLGQFKRLTSLQGEQYKYYFKSHDSEFGVVKEELVDDDSPLPCDKDRIVAWVVSNEVNQTSLFEPVSPYARLDNTQYPYDTSCNSRSPSFRGPRTLSTTESESSPCAIYIDVQLYLDNFNFLGLTLVGPAEVSISGQKGIYVQSITPGSAADIDGRIKVGDKIVEVNGVSLKSSSSDDAASIFKSFVDQRGPISIVLRRSVQPIKSREMYNNSPRYDSSNMIYTTSQRSPIDQSPSCANYAQGPVIKSMNQVPTNRPRSIRADPLYSLPRSLTPRSLYTSSNYDSWVPSSDMRVPLDSRSVHGTSQSTSLRKINATLHCAKDDIYTIYSAIKSDAKSLDIKDREWLKVTVKDAFLGSSLIKWLSRNVYGFCNRREIKSYANRMLNMGLIRGPIANSNFSGKCYYNLS